MRLDCWHGHSRVSDIKVSTWLSSTLIDDKIWVCPEAGEQNEGLGLRCQWAQEWGF